MRRVGGALSGLAVLVVTVGAVSAGPDRLLDRVDIWLGKEPAPSSRAAPPAGAGVAVMTEPPPAAPPPAAPVIQALTVDDFGGLLVPKPATAPARLAAAPTPKPVPEEVKRVGATTDPAREQLVLPPAPAPVLETDLTSAVVPTADAPAAAPPAPAPATMVAEAIPTWRRFAVATLLVDGAMIAVIIDDVGLNAERTRAAIDLPRPLTLSFLPYGVSAKPLALEARAAGHEVMLHMPMQPDDPAEDPGPRALLVGLPATELATRLTWYLDQLSGYVGINNHMGSRFTRDDDGMTLVMRELRRRGLLFVDSVTTSGSVALAAARRAGVPSLSRDIFLDNAIDARQIAAKLAEVEAVAWRNGQAIAIGHPHWATVEALRAWLPTLRQKGFTLAPVSALLRRRLTG